MPPCLHCRSLAQPVLLTLLLLGLGVFTQAARPLPSGHGPVPGEAATGSGAR